MYLVEAYGTTLRAALLRLAVELEGLEGPWGDKEPYVVNLAYDFNLENGPEEHTVQAFVEYPNIPPAPKVMGSSVHDWGIS